MREVEIAALPESVRAFIAALQAQNAALTAQVAALEARLNVPPKDSTNSSIPASKRYKPKRQRTDPPAKRGPKPGHRGVTRTLLATPNARDEAQPVVCADCGSTLAEAPTRRVERRQLIDLPPVQPHTSEAVRPVVACLHCGRQQQSAFPAGYRGRVNFGPRLGALVSYLHEIQSVPYSRLQQLLASLFTLPISLGSLVRLVARAGQAAAAAAEAIRAEVVSSPVVASDETGMRVDGRNEWLWVVRTPTASSYTLRPSRGSQVLRDLLGTRVPEVWLSDLCSAQMSVAALLPQICIAHQLRDLAYAIDGGDRLFAPAMTDLLLRALKLAKERAQLAPATFAVKRAAIEAECDRLLVLEGVKPAGAKLQARYTRHRAKLFVFLKRPDVPPDNNGSERDLRNAVIHRKVTGGFRSDWAPGAYAALLSVVETAKKRATDPFASLLHLLSPPLPPPS